MSVFVYETDLGVHLNNVGNFKNFSFKKKDHMVEVEIEKIGKLDPKNMWLAAEVQGKCWPVVQRSAARLVADLKKLDTKGDKAAEKKRDLEVERAVNNFERDLGQDLLPVVMKVFADFSKDKKDYKAFVTKAGVKIGINGLILVGSAVLTGVGGWSGAGTVVGIVGMVRSAASIGQQIGNLCLSLGDVHKRLKGNVVKMQKQLASPNIRSNTAKQAAGTVLNKVFAVEIQTLVVTVDGLVDDFELLDKKCKQVKVEVVKLSGKIPAMLDEQEKAQKHFDKFAAELKKAGKKPKEAAKAEAALEKIEKTLDKQLNLISGMSKEMDDIQKWVDIHSKTIEKLKTKYNGNAVKVAGVATDLVIALGSFVAADFSAPGQLIADLHDKSKQVVAGLALAYDGLGTLKDSAEAAKDAASD